ncbi:MAG: PTS sugar transporter subunit IIA [Gammaproteobacteria bacterium]|nr:PTS sugar transporter subunit IIA [Gammaproteobacteria bacterium]
MSVGLLIVTHGEVGQALLDSAYAMLGGSVLQVGVVSVANGSDPDEIVKEVGTAISTLNKKDGVLLLTDMYGATPSNIVMRLQDDSAHVMVVAGINLPMLIRVLNYPDLSIEQLLEKALSGGRDGIFCCRRDEL